MPIIPIIDTGIARTRVVHGIGVAVVVTRDENGFVFRRTLHGALLEALDDSEDEFLAECASLCRCCTDCGNQCPCGGVMAGGICDGLCRCDQDSDERYDDGQDGDAVAW